MMTPATDCGLASDAGMDTKNCEFCLKALDGKKPWKRGLDGMGAHIACIKKFT